MAQRLTLSNDLIRRCLSSIGYEAEPGRLHILGVRGATPVGTATLERVANRPNAYNDALLVFGSAFRLFKATVDPGSTWTLRPSNPRGVAHLVDGAYAYQFGMHRGKYRALVQAAPVRVWRDTNRNHIQEASEKPDSPAYLGINIHKGGSRPTVDSWSAGCQVLWNGDGQWEEFMGLLEGSGQKTFRYFLVDARNLFQWRPA